MFALLALTLLSPGQAVVPPAASESPQAAEKMVCKRLVQTGTRFKTRICKPKGEWDAEREASARSAKEMIDRPVVNTDRE
jgi:hypothetical protein